MNASRIKIVQKSLATLVVCLIAQNKAAEAYYYPLGYGNLVPGLLSAVPYFGFSFLNRGPYSSYPLFTLQNSLYRAGTRALASPYNYNSSYMNYSNTMNYALQDPSNYPYQAQTYYDPEPWYQPRQRTRPVRAGLSGVDQNIHATWQNAGPNNLAQAPTPTQPNYFVDPLRTPITGSVSNASPQDLAPVTAPGEMPPLAPQVVSKRHRWARHSQADSPAETKAQSQSQATENTAGPLAQGFIAKVNQVYDGDIGRALFDPEMRGWARCLDLVKDDDLIKLDLSPARVGLIQQIMKDNTLDDMSKLDAVKVLLRGGANRAN